MNDFYKLSQSERKIEVCKDVLKILDNDKYAIASSTGYFVPDDIRKYENKSEMCSSKNQDKWVEYVNGTFMKDLSSDQAECTVCARGAMFVTQLKRGFGVPCRLQKYGTITKEDTTEALPDFTRRELEMIEGIFEKGAAGGVSASNWEGQEMEFVKVLGTFSQDDKERLRDIMNRIIACKGDVVKALSCHEKT